MVLMVMLFWVCMDFFLCVEISRSWGIFLMSIIIFRIRLVVFVSLRGRLLFRWLRLMIGVRLVWLRLVRLLVIFRVG